MPLSAIIIRQIEAMGYKVSVHRINDTIELHAVKVPEGEPVWMVRNVDGDGEEETYAATCELAAMAGINLEDG